MYRADDPIYVPFGNKYTYPSHRHYELASVACGRVCVNHENSNWYALRYTYGYVLGGWGPANYCYAIKLQRGYVYD